MRIFIGYDKVESIAYHVLSHSIIRRASVPVSISPVALNQLGFFTRKRQENQSTDFSFSRFLVPYLCDYKGWAVFMDCDMLCKMDVADLAKYMTGDNPVQVVKHNYIPRDSIKFLGNVQTKYGKKNWSSMMIFNNEACKSLTPDYVNTTTGLDLHQFNWADSVGDLPLGLNWLVGEYPKNDLAPILHYTNGGPWFEESRFCDHHADWTKELKDMYAPKNG